MTETEKNDICELSSDEIDAVSGGIIEWLIIGGLAVAVITAMAAGTARDLKR